METTSIKPLTQSIIIADDHPLFVTGVEKTLRRRNVAEIYHLAFNGLEVLTILENHACNLVLLDNRMPEMNGFECAKKIRALYPAVRILCLSSYVEEEIVTKAFRSGAHGYLSKNDSPEIIMEGIKKVLSGEKFLSDKAKMEMLDDSLFRKLDRPDGIPLANVSERENQIVAMLAEGKTINEIGDNLFISGLTVKTHKQRMFKKFNVNRTAKLVEIFRKLNIIKNNWGT